MERKRKTVCRDKEGLVANHRDLPSSVDLPSGTPSFLPDLISSSLISATSSMTFTFSTPSAMPSTSFTTESLLLGTPFATKSRPPPIPDLYLNDTQSLKSEHQRLMSASDPVYSLPLTSLVPIPIVVGENFVIRQRESKSDSEVEPHKTDASEVLITENLQYSTEADQTLLLEGQHDADSLINIPEDTVDSQRLAFLEEVAVKTISEFCSMSKEYERVTAVESEPEFDKTLSALSEPERILFEHDYGSRATNEQPIQQKKLQPADAESDEDLNVAMKVHNRKRAIGDCSNVKCKKCSTIFSHLCKKKGRRKSSGKAKELLLKRRRFVAPPSVYTCQRCNKKLKGKAALKEHLATHTKLNTFACPLCDQLFPRRSNLHNHILSHDPKKQIKADKEEKTKSKTAPSQETVTAPSVEIELPSDAELVQAFQLDIENEPALAGVKPVKEVEASPSATGKKKGLIRVAKNLMTTKQKEDEPVVEVNEEDGTYDINDISSDDGEVYRVEDQNWDCNLCKVKCKTRTELVQHQSVEHEEDAAHSCTVCCRKFRRKAQLNRHMLIHTGLKAFHCETCGEDFSRRHHLDRHKLTHGDQKPYECETCHKKFIRQSQFDIHRARNACAKTMTTCPVCDKEFLYELAMRKHLDKHSKDADLTCYKCNIKFSDLTELSKHKTHAHRRQKLFSCDICKKSFSQVVYLKKHQTIHWGSTPFRCESCNRGFLTNGDLQRHIKAHDTPIDLTCRICEKTFNRKDLLQNHMLRHNGERQFVCETCGKSFFLQKHLKQHKYSHLPEKPFCCEVCGKTFTLNHNLQQHKLIHTGYRPFVCEECGRGFMRNDQLQKHKSSAHGLREQSTSQAVSQATPNPKPMAPKPSEAVTPTVEPLPRYVHPSLQLQLGQYSDLLQPTSQASTSSAKQFTVSKFDPIKFETPKFDLASSGINLITGKIETGTIPGLVPSATVLLPSVLPSIRSTSEPSSGHEFQYLQLPGFQGNDGSGKTSDL